MANGRTIKTYRKHTILLCFPSKQYKWDFIIAKVFPTLLGADFLRVNSLLVDLKGMHLVDVETYCTYRLHCAKQSLWHLSAICQSNSEYNKLLSNFSQITTPQFATLPNKHGVEYFIKTTGPPISVRARHAFTSSQVKLGQSGIQQKGGNGYYLTFDGSEGFRWMAPLRRL